MVGAVLAAIVQRIQDAPGRAALLALALMAAGVYGGIRITLEDDARSFIAGADPAVGVQLEVLTQFAAVEPMMIQIDGRAADGPDAHDGEPLAARLVSAARSVCEALVASGQFTEARFEAGGEGSLGMAEILMPRRFAIDPRLPVELFDPEALRRTLAELRQSLLARQDTPEGQLLGRDPVGSLRAALGSLSSPPGLSRLDPSTGRFFSSDGRSLLVLAVPKGDPLEGEDARRTMDVVGAAQRSLHESEPDFVLRPIGAHGYERDAQDLVQRDMYLGAGLTLVIVIAIFVVSFRRVRLALVAIPPLAFAVCTAAGIAGAWGKPVHGIVLAFSAACLCLSIDYSIHLLAAHALVPGGDPKAALPAAARRIGAGLTLAAAATIAGLLALSLSSVPALRQMAVLAAAAVAGAFAGNLVWLPILVPLFARDAALPSARRGPWTWAVHLAARRPMPVLAGCLVAAVALVAPATRSRVDADLRTLDTHSPEAVADERAFAESFGAPMSTAVVLAEAPDLDGVLRRAERAAALLRQSGARRIRSPTVVAPSRAVIEQRRHQWCDVTPSYAERLDAAAVELGFGASAFAGFAADLRAFCDGGADDGDPRPALAALSERLGRDVVRTGGEQQRLAVAFDLGGEDDSGEHGGEHGGGEHGDGEHSDGEHGDVNLDDVRAALAAEPGLTVVHRASLNRHLAEIIAVDIPRLGGIALALVTLLLLVAYRSVGRTLRALGPCAFGLVATLGLVAAFDPPLDLMTLCVFPLLCGLGIDYGILMTDADRDPLEGATEERAFSVVVAAATSLAAFGTLAMAHQAALASIGRAVLIAVSACAAAALLLPIALRRPARHATAADVVEGRASEDAES